MPNYCNCRRFHLRTSNLTDISPIPQELPPHQSATTSELEGHFGENYISSRGDLDRVLDRIDGLEREAKYDSYKLTRVSTNGLHGFDFHKIAPSPPASRTLAFFGPCSILPIVDHAINEGHEVKHISLSVDDNRQTHFTPPIETVNLDAVEANIIALPLRSVMAAGAVSFCGFENEIFWPRLTDASEVKNYFDECAEYIKEFIESLSEILGTRPSFILSFWEPRQNFLGKLFKRYDLKNPQYFVARLNEVLEAACQNYSNTYLLDVNDVLNSMGRFRIQDDYVREISHASNIFDAGFEDDVRRLQKSTPASHIYDVDGQPAVFGHCVFNEILDRIDIIASRSPIKLIIVDLDDTLWRGVLADSDRSAFERTDFWPMGLAEALLVFKARGGLLAICSKNDDALARAEFNRVWGGRLQVEDFVSIKINFQRKSENIQEILGEVNLLPGNVLFIDDNPREISEVKSILPELHVLSSEHYDWRRAIMLSPSTQVSSVSNESTRRTETLKAKIVRDRAKQTMSREEWLRSLGIMQRYHVIRETEDLYFSRAFELLNKTNQFNTTGRRWSLDEARTLFSEGGYIFCAFLRDKTTDNGMIGLHLVLGKKIIQSILSCRVFGLNSEYASISILMNHILTQHQVVEATYAPTGKNFYCEAYYKNSGFAEEDGEFRATIVLPHPPTVESNLQFSWS